MKLKIFTSALLILWSQSFISFGQITLSVEPDTPLDYFVFELTQPSIKSGYNKRSQYFGTNVANVLMGDIKAVKYNDLPLYSFYSQSLSFIDDLESRTTISRTTDYVAYVVEARNSASESFAIYSKDTFFLNGTTITRISQTIYDTEDNTEDSYASYNVIYHTNGKIEHIELSSINPETATYVFGGVTCVYNANNSLKSDTIYDHAYNFNLGAYGVRVYEYQDFLYKTTNANQIDTVFYYNVDYTQELGTKFIFVLNANNQVITQKGLTYNSGNNDYEQTFFYTYGTDPTLSVVTRDNIKIFQPYPNPTSDRIQLPKNVHGKDWSIYSSSGVLIQKGSGEIREWDVSMYPKGFYILQLTDGENSWQGKFLVK